jgi:pimeloyl-ACP methyl ester carboxylesterase
MPADPARPALVFLHHFGGSARSWDRVLEELGDEFETVPLDLPGFGAAAGQPGPYTISAYAERVQDRVLEGASYILVGHSMGGKIALALAARKPRGLRALVLLAPSPPTPEPIGEDMRARLIAGWGHYGPASETLARITAQPLDGGTRERVIADMMSADKGAWTAWLEGGSREDISGAMPRIDAPALILSGDRDEAIATDLVEREVAARLKTARVIVVPGAGHLLPLEAPDAVAGAIWDCADALRRVEAPVTPPPDPRPASAWRPGRNSSDRSDISPRSSCNNPDDILQPGRIARPAGSTSQSAS